MWVPNGKDVKVIVINWLIRKKHKQNNISWRVKIFKNLSFRFYKVFWDTVRLVYYILSMTAFALQWPSCVVATDNIQSVKTKYYCYFTENFFVLDSKCLAGK